MLNYRQILKQAWNIFLENPWLFLGLELLALFVLSLASNLPFVGWVFSGIFMLGIFKLGDRIINNQPIEYYDLFWYTRDFSTLMAAIILVTAYQFFLVLAIIAFILPGMWFIVAAIYYPFIFTFDENKQSGIEAIKSSLALVKGRWSDQFMFLLFLSGINLIGAAIFGIGLLVSLPISFISLYLMFKQLYFKEPQGEDLKNKVDSLIQVRPN